MFIANSPKIQERSVAVMSRNVLAFAIDAGGTMTDTLVVDEQGNFVI
jgi:hypothetical protein